MTANWTPSPNSFQDVWAAASRTPILLSRMKISGAWASPGIVVVNHVHDVLPFGVMLEVGMAGVLLGDRRKSKCRRTRRRQLKRPKNRGVTPLLLSLGSHREAPSLEFGIDGNPTSERSYSGQQSFQAENGEYGRSAVPSQDELARNGPNCTCSPFRRS